MTLRTRMLVVACASFLLAAATSGRAQTSIEQQVNAFVEGLRGRVSEASFENGRYHHAGIAFDIPTGWNYGGTIPGETADESARDSGTGSSGPKAFVRFRSAHTRVSAPSRTSNRRLAACASST
jgi:hypothetical protein